MGNSQQKPSETLENSQEERLEEDVNASFPCEICIKPMCASKKFKNCVHPFCPDCIAKYIEVNIEDHTAIMPCPGLNCQQVLDPLDCREIIPPSVFSKWCDVLCEDYVLGFERSYCPNRSCMALVVNECGGTVKKSECPNCKRLFCFQCKLAWHPEYRCEESRNMRDRNDILFEQLVETKRWIKCPRCGHCVAREEGCSSIRCRCGTSFCYRCGKKLSVCICRQSSNSFHAEIITFSIAVLCVICYFVLLIFISV